MPNAQSCDVKLFISPHNDDETLFGAFTLLRERPLVLIVYDSYVQFHRGDRITAQQRRKESSRAVEILGTEVAFCGLSDESVDAKECSAALTQFAGAEEVWVPAFEQGGHRHHNLISKVADSIFPRARHYMTYTSAGKSRGNIVPVEPGWVLKKLKALACYETQIELGTTQKFFLMDQYEYYLE
jgi:LmbE family N-acetylglucosaminyl deacetylase